MAGRWPRRSRCSGGQGEFHQGSRCLSSPCSSLLFPFIVTSLRHSPSLTHITRLVRTSTYYSLTYLPQSANLLDRFFCIEDRLGRSSLPISPQQAQNNEHLQDNLQARFTASPTTQLIFALRFAAPETVKIGKRCSSRWLLLVHCLILIFERLSRSRISLISSGPGLPILSSPNTSTEHVCSDCYPPAPSSQSSTSIRQEAYGSRRC